MDKDELALALEELTDEACAHETHRIPDEDVAAMIRLEIDRLSGKDVPPAPRGTPPRRGWALTPDGFARALSRLTLRSLGKRGSGLTLDDVIACLREEIERMCQAS
jgi:hypothetical protein